MASLDRKDIRNTFILITSVVIIAMVVMIILWLAGNSIDKKTFMNVFIWGPVFIIFSWLYYFNQKKRDLQDPGQPETLTQKAIKVDIKFSGIMNKVKSIGAFILSPILILGGILTLLGFGANFEIQLKYKLIIGIPIILIGIAFFFIAIYLRKLGSIQSEGRMYKQEPQQTNLIKPSNQSV